MAKLRYPDIIANDPKYTALVELSQRQSQLSTAQVMTTLVELLGDEFTPLLAEKMERNWL